MVIIVVAPALPICATALLPCVTCRACIEDAASEAPDTAGETSSSSTATTEAAGPAVPAAGAALLFCMDVPLLLQEVLWGLVRLAAAHPPLARAAAAASTGAPAAAGPSEPSPLTPGRRRQGWESCALLQRLQALMEGPGGVLRGVLGWAPETQEAAAGQEAAADVSAPRSQGSGPGSQAAEPEGLKELKEQEEGEDNAGEPGEQDVDELTGGVDSMSDACGDGEADV